MPNLPSKVSRRTSFAAVKIYRVKPKIAAAASWQSPVQSGQIQSPRFWARPFTQVLPDDYLFVTEVSRRSF